MSGTHGIIEAEFDKQAAIPCKRKL